LAPIENGATVAVAAQGVQAIWVDLFVAADAEVGEHGGRVTLTAGGAEQSIDFAVDVLEAAYPDDSCHHCILISYGNTWMTQQYPHLPKDSGPEQWEAMLPLIHKYHRIFFEHFGDYHQLGYGHSGTTNALFAPGLSGDGRGRHITDWRWYDRHYGPLLDGSAFAGCRRKARPIFA
ncbi:unnamed protein product, partial [marine sediment metagenome]